MSDVRMETSLEELARRCEAATAQEQREYLVLAAEAAFLAEYGDVDTEEAMGRIDSFEAFIEAKAWLDAAMTLVPEGFLVTVVNARDDNGKPVCGAGMALVCSADTIADTEAVYAATMPLALTAACLKARAQDTTP